MPLTAHETAIPIDCSLHSSAPSAYFADALRQAHAAVAQAIVAAKTTADPATIIT